ncbi:MAG: FimB/Mfa2 family fimbrial subunit [Alistipes sp.]|nr:FimB/Mfa2 family fimbrial subunit [Alistipes sp.]
MKKILILAAVLTVSFTSCRIYDPLYDGGLMLTTEWSERTEGVAIPDSYHVRLSTYSATHTEASRLVDHPFDPATHRLHIWHPAQGITVEGTVATVGEHAEEPQQTRQEHGGVIAGNPEWLFTCAMDAQIGGAAYQQHIAPMRQQVRQLTFIIRATGGSAGRIEGISGVLTGAAKSLDFDTDEHTVPSDVGLKFEKNADGDWQATVRLLGVTGERQLLSARIAFADGAPEEIALNSDLVEELTDFNVDKKTPLTLVAQLVETPSGAGFTATIEAWERIERGGVIAD